jgi:penicillin-binding protein 1C
MKTRVIPIPQSVEGDLSKARGLRKLRCVIRTSWVRSLALLGMTAWFVWLLLPKPPLLDGISFSQCVRDRNGKLLRVTLTTDQKFRVRTPLQKISPALIDATLRYEDKYYARHPGVNPVALLRAALTLRAGGAHSGASTITMQLARLRFHLPTRTLSGKFVQIIRALELERHYSKAEILEAYLNLAPYGRNIEGVGAASQIYFDKPASRLTRPEAVALSVIPQSPARRALFVDRDNRSLDSAQSNWYDRGKTDRQLSARLFRARAQSERKFLALHFVQRIVAAEKDRDEIVTTLDLAKQQLIERRIVDYIQTNRGRGIQNAVALLVDTRTMDVLAQIGSADFFNAEIQGQMDGTRAPRSPGSTLKPFVYALALEQGLIHPLSILSDAPHTFGDYNPENFDREFVGPIRASDALARSRNLPAVELASQLRHPALYEFLRGAGVKLPRSESVYGLALPLGGAEVTMEDLVQLYAALANNGELRPLRRTSRDPTALRGRSIIMPEAAFLTLEMLNLPRPEVGRAYSDQAAPVFWKTGTSHGFRDAWSIAVFNHYVLAIWIGNFDGRANGTFVGRIAAAPLLYQIIDSLRASWPEPNQPHLPPPGANLKRVSFCAVSGDLPQPYCAHQVEGWFIPGISPIKLCDVHQEVLVDAASGLRVPRDDGTRQLRREVYEFWPTELLSIFRRAGVPRKLPPPFLPETDPELVARTGNPPRIIAPAAGAAFEVLNSDSSRKQGIPLRAKTDADVRAVYWFADKTFIGKSPATDILSWKSAPGRYELTALDDHGRSGSCSVTVR